MTIFWIIATLLIGGALLFALPPLLKRGAHANIAFTPLNLAVYRDQAQELEADHRAGTLSAEQYDRSRRELELRLLEDTGPAETTAPQARHSSRASALAITLGVPALAVGLYFSVGTPQVFAPQPVAAKHGVAPEQIQTMVGNLAERLRQNPGDAEGWALLGRSYNVLGRFEEASMAYGKAAERVPGNAALLADYADALAMARGRKLQGDPEALIQRALSIDPNHIKSLALAGTIAFERQDYASALKHWEKILQLAPPESVIARSISSSISEARGLAGSAGVAMAAQVNTKPAQPVTGGVGGTVKLAPALAAKIAPEDTVFIFVRAAEGSRIPLAILRKKAGDLPIIFALDDSMAMSPAMRLSAMPQVIVGARVSKSANAIPQPGDLQGFSPVVKNTQGGIEIVIDAEVR